MRAARRRSRAMEAVAYLLHRHSSYWRRTAAGARCIFDTQVNIPPTTRSSGGSMDSPPSGRWPDPALKQVDEYLETVKKISQSARAQHHAIPRWWPWLARAGSTCPFLAQSVDISMSTL